MFKLLSDDGKAGSSLGNNTDRRREILKQLVTNQESKLVDVMQTVLSLRFKTWETDEKNILSYSKNNQKTMHIDNDLNVLKTNVYYLCKKLVKVNNREAKMSRFIIEEKSKFHEFLLSLVTVTVNSLSHIIKNHKADIKDIFGEKDAKFFITSKINFLCASTESTLLMSKLYEVRETVFWDIILLFSVSGQDELEQMDSSPPEFVNFSMDCVGTHKSKVPKTEVIKLYEYSCDNLDGFTNYSFTTLVDLMTL